MNTCDISLVLPIYNPSAGWAATIAQRVTEIKYAYPTRLFQLIVVNDGSTNGQLENELAWLKNNLEVQFISYPKNKGKGHALRTGIAQATGSIILYTDVDFPYTLASFQLVTDTLLLKMAEVVIGIKDKNYYQHVPPLRKLISRTLRLLIRLLLRIPIDDTQCGLKGFHSCAKHLFLQTTIQRYLFDLEFVFLCAHAKDIRLQTQEIQLRKEVKFRDMNWRLLLPELGNFLNLLIKRFLR